MFSNSSMHWGWDQMPATWQTTISNAFSLMKCILFKCRKNLFSNIQLTIYQHWLRWWLGTNQATSHYMNQWQSSLLMHICITPPWWINESWHPMMLHIVYISTKLFSPEWNLYPQLFSNGTKYRSDKSLLKYHWHRAKSTCCFQMKFNSSVVQTRIFWRFRLEPWLLLLSATMQQTITVTS